MGETREEKSENARQLSRARSSLEQLTVACLAAAAITLMARDRDEPDWIRRPDAPGQIVDLAFGMAVALRTRVADHVAKSEDPAYLQTLALELYVHGAGKPS